MRTRKEASLPIRLDTDISRRLDQMAERLGLTKSALVRLLIKSFVDHVEANGGRVELPMKWPVPDPTAAKSDQPLVVPPLSVSERQVAREFAGQVRTHFGPRVRRIWLYGSTARGDWRPESDIDVLALLDHVAPPDNDWLIQRAFKLGLMENGLLLQPLFMAEPEFMELLARERQFSFRMFCG